MVLGSFRKALYSNSHIVVSGILIGIGSIAAIGRLMKKDDPHIRLFDVKLSMTASPENYFNHYKLPKPDWTLGMKPHASIYDSPYFEKKK